MQQINVLFATVHYAHSERVVLETCVTIEHLQALSTQEIQVSVYEHWDSTQAMDSARTVTHDVLIVLEVLKMNEHNELV